MTATSVHAIPMATAIAGTESSACQAMTATATMKAASKAKRVVLERRGARRAGAGGAGRLPRGSRSGRRSRRRLRGGLGGRLVGEPDLPLRELLHLLAELRHPASQVADDLLRLGALAGLLGLALELGDPHPEVGQLVRESQALGLDGERAELGDLLRLPLEAVEDLPEERREHVLAPAGCLQLPLRPRGGGGTGRRGRSAGSFQPPREAPRGRAPSAGSGVVRSARPSGAIRARPAGRLPFGSAP